ncbi:hypothetical protein GRX03_04820 [Halovenus sp. WSH3]|uniref:Rpa-associated protein n=1 Tax=Halovenus carboxidivorans TaxID=2692199 RepID=A0A6B0T6T4_9EURY|nr:hypothetical protein [Halovenus carboxidivorans]MXR50931.1 hypothetical protein [Halovenus carboxidivorans]
MSESEGSGAGQREVAYRIFAAEFEAADYDYSESDEERAPNYVITPTGARANRLFVVGVLTEVEQVSDDVLRARVVDPTGAFVLYAGQYQPDEQAVLEELDPPTFVAVTGKARTFQPEDSDQVFTSIRPESISEVDGETRDRWTVQTAEQTVDRVRWMTTALRLDAADLRAALGERGADDGLAHGIELALDHYGTTPTYLDAVRDMALDAARTVSGDLDEVGEFGTAPDADGRVTVADLAATLSLPDEGGETGGSDASGTSQDGATATADEPASSGADSAGGRTETELTAQEEPDSSTSTTEPTEASGSDDVGPSDSTPESTEPTEGSPADSAPAEPSSDPVDSEPLSADGSEAESDPVGGTGDSGEVDDLGEFEPGEFELEEETREEIEEEFGTEFQSGTEVDEPGSAGIETPDPDVVDREAAEPGSAGGEPSAGEEGATTTDSTDSELESGAAGDVDAEPEADPGESTATSEPEDVEAESDDGSDPAESTSEDGGERSVEDPQGAVVDLMGELDDGDGADRERLIAEMGERYGLDSEAVEEAIQSALMDGQCYEPDDDTLKPI